MDVLPNTSSLDGLAALVTSQTDYTVSRRTEGGGLVEIVNGRVMIRFTGSLATKVHVEAFVTPSRGRIAHLEVARLTGFAQPVDAVVHLARAVAQAVEAEVTG